MKRNQWLTVRSATPIDEKSTDSQGKNGTEDDDSDDDDDEMDMAMLAYNIYMKEVIIAIAKELDPGYKIEENVEKISRVIQATVNISRHIYNFIDMAENASKIEDRDGNLSDLIYIKVRDLDKLINEGVTAGDTAANTVQRYMTLMLTGLPEAYFDFDEDVLLTSNADMLYLKSAIKLIYETSSMDLEAFLWWSIVEELILYTTSSMRQLYHEYTKIITGVEGVLSRPSYCTTSINKLMGYAVSYTIVEKNFMQRTKPKVERMLANIRSAFKNIIYHSWMDWETKERSLRKSEKMKSLIGFPEWILNKTRLEMFYDGVRLLLG
jgi:predicted metalloendopeptidase